MSLSLASVCERNRREIRLLLYISWKLLFGTAHMTAAQFVYHALNSLTLMKTVAIQNALPVLGVMQILFVGHWKDSTVLNEIKTAVDPLCNTLNADLDNISNKQVLAPQILCVLTVQLKHIQTALSHPVYHTQNVMPWDLLKQIQEHNHLTVNVEIPRLLQQPLLVL
ncbi:unnamed protein product [Leuciscus chuanchicus]